MNSRGHVVFRPLDGFLRMVFISAGIAVVTAMFGGTTYAAIMAMLCVMAAHVFSFQWQKDSDNDN